MFFSSGTSSKLELQQENPQWDADIRDRRGTGEAFGRFGGGEAEALPAHEGALFSCSKFVRFVRFHPVASSLDESIQTTRVSGVDWAHGVRPCEGWKMDG